MQSAGVIKSSAFDLLTYARAQLFTSNPALAKGVKLTHQITFDDGSNMIGLGWLQCNTGNRKLGKNKSYKGRLVIIRHRLRTSGFQIPLYRQAVDVSSKHGIRNGLL
jgi:hypothetical protein